MRARRVVVLVLCAAACSDSATQKIDAGAEPDAPYDIDEGAASGTRLKLRYYDFGNVRELVGIRDTQRAEDCTPTEWSDGNTYCRPASAESVFYDDDMCTQPIGVGSSDPCAAPPPAYYYDLTQTACGSLPSRLLRRGAVIARSGYYYSINGTCNAAGGGQNYTYYALTAEVPTSELAALTLSAPAMTGRVGVRYQGSVDGLRYPVQYFLHDSELGRCSPAVDSPGATTGHCLPSDVASYDYFADAACAQHLAFDNAGCPAHAVAVMYGACAWDPPRYFAVGAKQTLTTVYSDDSGTCTAMAPPADTEVFAVGAELTLATLAHETKTGPERLQPSYFTNTDGLRARDRNLFDSQLGDVCTAQVQSNGNVECIPFHPSWQTMFTDAGCTNAVDIVQEFRQPTCAAPPAPKFSVNHMRTSTSPLVCGYEYVVRRVGPLATGPIFRGIPGNCTLYSPANFLLYTALDILAPGELATGTLVTAP